MPKTIYGPISPNLNYFKPNFLNEHTHNKNDKIVIESFSSFIIDRFLIPGGIREKTMFDKCWIISLW